MTEGIRAGLLVSAALLSGGCQILFAPAEPARGDGGAGRADAASGDPGDGGGAGRADGASTTGGDIICGRLGAPIVFDDFESGLGNWTTYGNVTITSNAACRDGAFEAQVAEGAVLRNSYGELSLGQQPQLYLRVYVFVASPLEPTGEVELFSFAGNSADDISLSVNLLDGTLTVQGTQGSELFETSLKLSFDQWQRIAMDVEIDTGGPDTVSVQTGGQTFSRQDLDESFGYIDTLGAGIPSTDAPSAIQVRLDEFSLYKSDPP